MKYFFVICFVFAGYQSVVHGQPFYNTLPDVGGLDMQGGCREIILYDSILFIIGHRYDTSYGGSDAKPWISKINNSGEPTEVFSLKDDNYSTPFNYRSMKYIHKADNIYFGYSGRFINSNSTPYLFEFNIETGHIIKSILIPNNEYPDDKIAPSELFFDGDTISLLSYYQTFDSVRAYITELDTFFNVLREIKLESTFPKQFPKYFSKEMGGNYTIVGSALVDNTPFEEIYNFYYVKLDKKGAVIKSYLSPTTIPISNLISQSKTVHRALNGNWIIAGHFNIYYPDSCLQCIVSIPYMFSVSSEFDSLLWERRFMDIPPVIGPYYNVYALTAVVDGYIATSDFTKFDLTFYPNSGVLFKANLEGDSLWMKHYIPLEWEEDRVAWAKLFDIKTTPSGSIIAVGEIADRQLEIIRPWILHLDSDGCLVPGCNLVSTEREGENEISSKFRIFPNPTSSELYLLSEVTSGDPLQIQIISESGILMKSRSFYPTFGDQYILPMDDLPGGFYFITFVSNSMGILETHSFVKE
jgi:hypothetical protein